MDKLCEHVINLIITLVGTGAGVLGAFHFDNRREANDNRQRKIRLVKSLHAEISELEKFFERTKELLDGDTYSIETHITDDTTQEQIDCIENMELILKLSSIRRFTNVMTKRFEAFENAYVQRNSSVMNTVWGNLMAAKKNAWPEERKFGIGLIRHTIKLLEEELPGLIKNQEAQNKE